MELALHEAITKIASPKGETCISMWRTKFAQALLAAGFVSFTEGECKLSVCFDL